jgi:hypothetical protein
MFPSLREAKTGPKSHASRKNVFDRAFKTARATQNLAEMRKTQADEQAKATVEPGRHLRQTSQSPPNYRRVATSDCHPKSPLLDYRHQCTRGAIG